MVADTGGFANDRDIEIRNTTTPRTYTLCCKGEKSIGRCAPPLCVAWREMHTNIALRNCAENGISERMQDDVGIGMPGEGSRVRNSNASECDVVARAESVHIHSGADAHIADRGRLQGLRTGKILGSGELDVVGLPGKNAHLDACPFRKCRIVGEIIAACGRGTAMGVQQGLKRKCLRCLHEAAMVRGRWLPRRRRLHRRA